MNMHIYGYQLCPGDVVMPFRMMSPMLIVSIKRSMANETLLKATVIDNQGYIGDMIISEDSTMKVMRR